MTEENFIDADNEFIKSTDKNPSNILPKKLTLDSYLKFACHPDVPCFTACCHNIKIVLTPYDILVLRKRLGMAAHEFITEYTQPTYLEKTDMPGVQIKLKEDTGGCPFVTPEGCTVYSDRPSACRYYPVGMADFHEGGTDDADEERFFFIVKEPHCKGFEEDKEWTVREWREDQGVDVRDEMNKEWLRLIMRRKSFGHQATLSDAAKRMFFMASTDLDSFRKFIFDSSFLDTYEVDEKTLEGPRLPVRLMSVLTTLPGQSSHMEHMRLILRRLLMSVRSVLTARGCCGAYWPALPWKRRSLTCVTVKLSAAAGRAVSPAHLSGFLLPSRKWC